MFFHLKRRDKQKMTDKIFDEKKIEKGIKDARKKMDKGVKDAREGFDDTTEALGDKYNETAKMISERGEEMAEKVRERPLEWIAGAFIAGMIISKLLSRKE